MTLLYLKESNLGKVTIAVPNEKKNSLKQLTENQDFNNFLQETLD